MSKHLHAADGRTLTTLLAACLTFATTSALAVTIDTVLVGNPGNTPDQNYGAAQFGGVAESFRIGRFEVTNEQYADFLNAVAPTDTYGLYNTFPKGEPLGIQCSGASGSFVYSVRPNMGNKPANAVSFWDACAVLQLAAQRSAELRTRSWNY